MQPNNEPPPISSQQDDDQPPPPPEEMVQPTEPKVLPPPLHYQSYNPMMYPNQPAPPFPMGVPPQFYNLPPGSASPYPFALSPTSSVPSHLYPDHERHWSTGPFQCTSNITNCFKTLLCPCVTFGEIAEILTEGHTPWYEPATLCACLGAASFVFIFLLWLTFPYTCLYRLKMRRKYKLKGSLVEDCMINAFCGWCALCQQYRELDHQGFNVSIGWHENKRRERQAVAVFRLIPPEEQDMTR